MNKNELVSVIADKCEMTKKDTEKVINALTDTICEALKEGERVQIVGFGSFEVKERAAHKGHNPITKEEMMIPATKSPFFKAGKILKDSVRG